MTRIITLPLENVLNWPIEARTQHTTLSLFLVHDAWKSISFTFGKATPFKKPQIPSARKGIMITSL